MLAALLAILLAFILQLWLQIEIEERLMKRKKPTGSKGRVVKKGRPPGSFTQHKRLDRLKQLLALHPNGLTLDELAAQLQVTTRSVRRYLKETAKDLELERVPCRQQKTVMRWRVRPSEVPRQIRLRRTQAYAFLAARKLFEPMQGSALFDEIRYAADQLLVLAQRPGRGPNAGVADARLEERFLYLPVAPKTYGKKTEELDDLFQAVADLRPLTCRYRSAHRGAEEKITIHPYALVLYKDAIYCVGYHTGRDDIRTFALDRMRDTELSALGRFELPQSFKIDDYFQGEFGIWRSSKRHRVVIEFDERVAELVRSRKVHGTQKLKALPGGGVRLTITIGDLKELTSWILGWGCTAKVVEPEELVVRVREELEGALRKYLPAEGETKTTIRKKGGKEPSSRSAD